MINFLKKLQAAAAVYANMKAAPDTVMVKKSVDINFSVFRKNNRENPLANIRVNPREFEMALLDLSLIIGAVIAVLMICSLLRRAKRRIECRREYKKRLR